MPSAKNLVLTGFMGTGKTAVGLELARKLGMGFADTDALIEARHGPIGRIFDEQGESGFRSVEAAIAEELGQAEGLVIATGGSTVLYTQNLRALGRNARIFCLVASPDQIYERVTSDPSRIERPLLKVEDPQQRIVELMAERVEDYARFPQIETDGREPGEIADEIVELWRES